MGYRVQNARLELVPTLLLRPLQSAGLLSAVGVLCVAFAVFRVPVHAEESSMRCLDVNRATGISGAVVVPDVALAHTAQLLPLSVDGQLIGEDPDVQIDSVLDQLEKVLSEANSGLDCIVRLNCCLTDARFYDSLTAALSRRYSGAHAPSVSVVVTRLPVAGACIAADAVATLKPSAEAAAGELQSVRHLDQVTIMPSGSRIYISGQAEQSESLAEATRLTLNSLRATLKFLNRSDADIVQLKAFLMPMDDADVVRREVTDFFGQQDVPPAVLVEWKSGASTPVEIELVAWGGPPQLNAPRLEFSTPPGMTKSPIYSRLCRIHHGGCIFLSGLTAEVDSGEDTESVAVSQREVRDVFAQLSRLLEASGSDLRHLVKATYYVAGEAVSTRLNELRPQYYDPERPPAASKAMVTGVGHPHARLLIDMIAVPIQ